MTTKIKVSKTFMYTFDKIFLCAMGYFAAKGNFLYVVYALIALALVEGIICWTKTRKQTASEKIYVEEVNDAEARMRLAASTPEERNGTAEKIDWKTVSNVEEGEIEATRNLIDGVFKKKEEQ